MIGRRSGTGQFFGKKLFCGHGTTPPNPVTELPKAEHDAEEWQAAMQVLLLVAEHDGPAMFARIGIMRADAVVEMMHCGRCQGTDEEDQAAATLQVQSLMQISDHMRWRDEIRRGFGETFGSSCVFVSRKQSEEDKLMRISILATIFACGTVFALPAQAQQSTGSSSQQQTQDEADKGIKTRNSGESGYVGEQEKPGASSHVPGQSGQTTTGSSSTRETGGKAGGVSVGEQEKKPVTSPTTSQPR
jgi:hypothetical protein